MTLTELNHEMTLDDVDDLNIVLEAEARAAARQRQRQQNETSQ